MSTSKFKYPAGSVGDGTLRPQRVLEEGSALRGKGAPVGYCFHDLYKNSSLAPR